MSTHRQAYKSLALLGLLLSYLPGVFAQNAITLSGSVIDAATNKPMPFANVYLNNSTKGTLSDEKGHFVLTNIPVGTVDVVASFVGYQTTRQTIRINRGTNSPLTFRLKPSDQTLVGVTVKAKRNEKKWQQQLRQFQQQLFGEYFGSQCVLTNPDVLQFTEEAGHLKATASEPLVIDNQALGYRIWFDLAYFDGEAKQVYYGGSAHFQELKAANEHQAARFRRNQMRAYLGSVRHLMASLVAGDYEQEGFRVFEEDTTVAMPVSSDTNTLQRAIGHRLLPLNRATLIQPGVLPFEHLLGSTKPLVVFYTKSKSLFSPYTDARYAYTQLTFPNGPIQVLTDGWITVPNGVVMKGSLANDRLSTLLPVDWKAIQAEGATSSNNAVPVHALPERSMLYTTEKAYVQTDRALYVAGDTLWFNAYLLDATQHTPSQLSQTLYVNLLDSTGKLMASRILHIDSTGHAPGDITLSDSLPNGTYQLVAYTNWMRNTDPAFLFRKRIWIEPRNSRSVKGMVNESDGVHLEVFPEGGQLVIGLPGRVAFKAIDSQGHSLSVTGVLTNQRGDTLTDFRSLHLGMGMFSVTPQPGQHYKAMATTTDGQQTSVDLPNALPTGYQLAVDNVTNPSQIRVQIRNSQPQLGYLTLFAHMRGQVCYQAKVDANKTDMLLAIPYDSIRQDGILHLTLFDIDNQPIAERLVFINQNRQLGIRMQMDKPTYQPRQPVTLTVSTTDGAGKPVSAQLSLAVTDQTLALNLEPKAATLRSYLLLTSDLRGYIEEPEFYFDSTRAHVKQYLDYVMLTHGWRRFAWRAILSDSVHQAAFDVERGISLRGRIDTEKPVGADGLTAMLKTDRNLVPLTIEPDKEGQFVLKNLLFADTATIIVHEKMNHPVQLYWLPNTLPDFVALPSLSVNNLSNRQQLINQALEQQEVSRQLRVNGGRMLQTVNVKAKRSDAGRIDYRRQSYGTADATVVATDQMRSVPTIFQMMTGQEAGVGIGVDVHGNQAFTLRGGGWTALALVDGVMVSNAVLPTINPNDIEAIDILKNPATYGIYGLNAQYGVINILTRRGLDPDKKINQVISQVVGYAVSREFYSPQYTSQSTTNMPDNRATLYWNPSIRTDATGKATVTFYNSDKTTHVRAVAEGISPAGQPGYGTLDYQVQK
ncbi:carboxypeptidase-like regulatory domain-containing protein [Spirosoma gilvum]